MLACPHCQRRALSFARKCVLSPDQAVPCVACGRKIGVPWGAVAAAVPVALGIIAAIRLPTPWNALGAIAGVSAYGILQRWVVPLESREG